MISNVLVTFVYSVKNETYLIPDLNSTIEYLGVYDTVATCLCRKTRFVGSARLSNISSLVNGFKPGTEAKRR